MDIEYTYIVWGNVPLSDVHWFVPMQFATVYKAEDEKENRIVAVKKIKLKLSNSLRDGG